MVSLAADWRWEDVLPQWLDWCLWSVVVLAPLAWGGRGDGARAVYALAAIATMLAWLANEWLGQPKGVRLSSLLLIPTLAVAWLVLQIVPLPSVVLEALAPGIASNLPVWNSNEYLQTLGIDRWRTLSLHPTSSQVSLAVLLCHAMVLFVALQRIRTRTDVAMVLRWIAQAGIVMALFGLLQYFTADGRFFWVFEHPFRRSDDYVCGAFINRNHFASFLAMGAAAIAYQIVRVEPAPKSNRQPATQVRDYQPIAWSVGLAVVLLAMLMSASRGGVLSAVIGTSVMAAVYWRRKLVGGKQLGFLAIAAGALSVGLTLYSEDRLTGRLEDLTTGSVDAMDRLGGRRAIWAANVRTVGQFWLTGAGAGTHQDVYPLFMTRSYLTPFTHAENGYLQIATELGLPGLGLLATTLGFVAWYAAAAWRVSPTREHSACLGAVAAIVVISLVHSAFDFVWYIPATMTTALLAIVVLRRIAIGDAAKSAPDEDRSRKHIEIAAVALAAVAYIAVVLGPPAIASPAWNRYRAASARLKLAQQPAYTNAAKNGGQLDLTGTTQLLAAEVDALRATVKANPHSAAAHLRLSRVYLQWFDARSELRPSRMNLGNYQQAVLANGFQSPEAVDLWLQSAIGDDLKLLHAARGHAAAAVRLSPLEPLGYICLANLDFLSNRSASDSQPLLAQAARLSPYDGMVLFEIGKHQLVSHQQESALEYLVRSFQQEGNHQFLVVSMLAGQAPAASFLENFAPDWKTLRSVWQRYLAAGNPGDLDLLLAYARQKADEYDPLPQEVPPAYIWMWLGEMYGAVDNIDEQIACTERAMQQNASFVPVRRAYGRALFDAERYADAEPHLRWCVARDPSNPGLRQLLQLAAARRHRNHRTLTATPNSPSIVH